MKRAASAAGSSPSSCGAVDDLVVDVGDVADVVDLEAARAQMARHQIEGDEGAAVADVDEVVDRRAADVEADLAGHERRESIFLRESVSWMRMFGVMRCATNESRAQDTIR